MWNNLNQENKKAKKYENKKIRKQLYDDDVSRETLYLKNRTNMRFFWFCLG